MSDLGELTVQQLQDEVAMLAAHIYAGTCRWLELVGELDRRGVGTSWVAARALSGWPGVAHCSGARRGSACESRGAVRSCG